MNAELTVRKTIAKHDLIPKGSRVVLGLSGGPDSLSLLTILARLQKPFDFKLEALHLNHLMRGADAEADVAFLEEYCAGIGVHLEVRRCDVYAKAAAENISVEEAGRAARHQALKEYAGTDLIAFAHNRDDQAETVLMRMLRGTGVHGLSAMEYKRPDGVIRPLLDTPRTEIERYCREHGLCPRYDSTNGSLEYTRNRLRLQLIPQLQEEYNPNLKEGLFRLSRSAAEDDDCLQAMARTFCQSSAVERSEGCITADKKALKALHPAVFKRVVRLLFLELGLSEDIASSHLNSLQRTVNEGQGRAVVEFPGGCSASTRAGKVIFCGPAR